ncbi:hypothetical protein [Bradyrhizobium sp. 33ap4]|uniref:hypothetical protein n=1 Tax=Bradyrhizobium sp. 33ap4 TaxID=3061630 RepID=UPI002931A742|nr:hypothetical protein [Bradyrhizobium sp. 33ap4]
MSLPQANGYRIKRSPTENVGRLGKVGPDDRKIVERAKKDEGNASRHPSPTALLMDIWQTVGRPASVG